MTTRMFNISIPTDEVDEDTIKKALNHKSITEWAYILQDNGSDPPHYSIVGKCSYAIETDVIGKWFKLPGDRVGTPKGRGAFLKAVGALLSDGTKTYEDREMKSNFNWREQLDAKKPAKKAASPKNPTVEKPAPKAAVSKPKPEPKPEPVKEEVPKPEAKPEAPKEEKPKAKESFWKGAAAAAAASTATVAATKAATPKKPEPPKAPAPKPAAPKAEPPKKAAFQPAPAKPEASPAKPKAAAPKPPVRKTAKAQQSVSKPKPKVAPAVVQQNKKPKKKKTGSGRKITTWIIIGILIAAILGTIIGVAVNRPKNQGKTTTTVASTTVPTTEAAEEEEPTAPAIEQGDQASDESANASAASPNVAAPAPASNGNNARRSAARSTAKPAQARQSQRSSAKDGSTKANNARTSSARTSRKSSSSAGKFVSANAAYRNMPSSLKRDASLESAAQIRAKELAESFSHTRPNGSSFRTAYPNYATKEIISRGYLPSVSANGANAVGAACYEVNGVKYWVIVVGNK